MRPRGIAGPLALIVLAAVAFVAVPRAANAHPGPSGKPTGVKVTGGWHIGSLRVSWNAPALAESYWVQWKSGSQSYGDPARQARVWGTSHTLTGLDMGTEYDVRVQAISSWARHSNPHIGYHTTDSSYCVRVPTEVAKSGQREGDADGVDQPLRFLECGARRDRLQGAVEVREPVVRLRPATYDHRHELPPLRPARGQNLFGAGHRHPPGRRRQPLLREDRDNISLLGAEQREGKGGGRTSGASWSPGPPWPSRAATRCSGWSPGASRTTLPPGRRR